MVAGVIVGVENSQVLRRTTLVAAFSISMLMKWPPWCSWRLAAQPRPELLG